jgi:hypothetical protein
MNVTGVTHSKTPEQRFWEKVDIRGGDDCWNWLAGNSGGPNGGYGRFGMLVDGKVRMLGAHRLSYEWAHGPFPRELHILHRCDNPACVNPKHLFPGPPVDNIHDSIKKGRFARGEMKSKAKLRSQDVERIHEVLLFGAKGVDLASTFGVSAATISCIASGKRWAHMGVQHV